MRPFQSQATVIAGLMLVLPAVSTAQVVIDGISLRDRTVAGEISLGVIRGGLAVIDYDGDGWMDIFVGDRVNERNDLFRNVPDPNYPGKRTLMNVTIGSGLDDFEGTSCEAVGALAADYDNDRDTDLFLPAREPGRFGLLYRNNGGTFTNVTVAAGVRGLVSNVDAASWADYDLDGWLDLLVVTFAAPWITLYHNNGDGTFTNAAQLLPPVPGFSHCYAATWVDYDRDGWPDCFLISNGGAGTEILLHNISDGAGGRRFENAAQAAGYTAHGPAPMGIAPGDYDLDGDIDIAISDGLIGTFYRNNGNGTFTKVQPCSTFFGWGVAWIDVDNDADLDFYTAGSWSGPQHDFLGRNLGGGAFSNISPALNSANDPTQHSVQVDLNNDGRQEFVAVVPFNYVSVYENVSTTPGHWLKIELRGDGVYTNRDGANAFVRVTAGGQTQVAEKVIGSSTTSTEDPRLHFGLGAASTVDQIEVVWPRAGTLAERTEVYAGPIAADQLLTLTPQRVPGDANCDGSIDFFDIDAFLLALFDAPAFPAAYPGCDMLNADVSRDGSIDFFDIDPFLGVLF